MRGLSSWTSVAILHLLFAWCSVGSLSGMSHMADRDHIAITSRDASTTRRKFLYRDAQLLRRSLSLTVSLVILMVASRRFRK